MNVLLALDQNARSDLQDAEKESAVALEQFVEAQRRISELRAAIELREAMVRFATPESSVASGPF